MGDLYIQSEVYRTLDNADNWYNVPVIPLKDILVLIASYYKETCVHDHVAGLPWKKIRSCAHQLIKLHDEMQHLQITASIFQMKWVIQNPHNAERYLHNKVGLAGKNIKTCLLCLNAPHTDLNQTPVLIPVSVLRVCFRFALEDQELTPNRHQAHQNQN